MIADQKGKLVVLAKDIFENGLSPTDLIMVVRMTEGKNQYKVLEGNRRVTCLKLIDNPNFIPGEYASIRRQFQSMANNKERASQLRRPLCVIFDNEEEAQAKARKFGLQIASIGVEVELVDCYGDFNKNDAGELNEKEVQIIRHELGLKPC